MPETLSILLKRSIVVTRMSDTSNSFRDHYGCCLLNDKCSGELKEECENYYERKYSEELLAVKELSIPDYNYIFKKSSCTIPPNLEWKK